MELRGLPDSYRMRPVTLNDVEGAVALINAHLLEQLGEAWLEGGDLRAEWEMPGRDLGDSVRVVETPDGGLVGYVEVWDLEPHVRVHVQAYVHPEFRGEGIGTALCQWAEGRARQAIAKAPPDARVTMDQSALSTDSAARDLLERQGYQLIRSSYEMVIEMDAPPPEPAVPAGITIRPYVPGQEEDAVLLAERDAFRDHWGYIDQPLEEDRERQRHWIANDPRYDPSLWFVAMDDGVVAGVSLCCLRAAGVPEVGYVDSLAVRRPWRRRGVGLSLLHHSFGEFYRRGTRKVWLGVDAQSLTGATRLYEKAGMRVERQYIDYIKELRPGIDRSTQSLEE
jgi:mycothiol synthase